jgi:hypothetical protein
MTLYERFIEAAQLDLEAAKVLTERGLYPPAIYHLQQAYENVSNRTLSLRKCINNTPEAYVYKIIKTRLRHDALVGCTYSINALVFSIFFSASFLFVFFVIFFCECF